VYARTSDVRSWHIDVQVNTEIVSIQKVITSAGAAHLKELIQVCWKAWQPFASKCVTAMGLRYSAAALDSP